MDLTALSTTNQSTVLLLGGVALLVVNLLYGLIRTLRGNVKGGWFTVALALLACTLIGVGSVSKTLANPLNGPLPSLPGVFPSAGVSVAQNSTPQAGTPAGVPAANPSGGLFGGMLPRGGGPTDAERTAIAKGEVPVRLQTAIAAGIIPPPMQTAIFSGQIPVGGPGSPTNTTATGGTAAGALPNGANSAPPVGMMLNLFGSVLAAAAGAGCLLLGIVLYYLEQRRVGFSANTSRGILNAGAGLFVIVASLVIPMIPGQLSVTSRVAAANATGTKLSPTRIVVTATPTRTPLPTKTSTPLPTLTPTQDGTLSPLATPINYAYAPPSATPTATLSEALKQCSVTTQAQLNLRADPSTKNAAVGRVPANVELVVLGQSSDKAWWQVSYNDGTTTQTGWISAQYATVNADCTLAP